MKTVLVTGFEPFPGMPVNPTALLMKRLPRRLIPEVRGTRFLFEILPTTWTGRFEVAERLRRDLSPDAIVHFGVDGSRRTINIETRAVNRATRVKPDAGGAHAETSPLQAGAETARTSTLPFRALYEAAARSGLPVALSRDAGTYLCNATLWDSIGSGIPSVFVHVPPLPRGRFDTRPSLQQIEKAAILILEETRRRI
ncbi:pyroglutamyl-peptidase I [Roseibium aggregatum]|uniref:pyroglutamyl-peptidase I n=1 Tax=Roseibium aggregatum TaxID=187304 RepID=UPI0022A885C6|nr:pyroglutamyl-peptidase I [Roseibium aggregatum]